MNSTSKDSTILLMICFSALLLIWGILSLMAQFNVLLAVGLAIVAFVLASLGKMMVTKPTPEKKVSK